MRQPKVDQDEREWRGRAPARPVFRGDRMANEMALREQLTREIAPLHRPLFLQLTPREKAEIWSRVMGARHR